MNRHQRRWLFLFVAILPWLVLLHLSFHLKLERFKTLQDVELTDAYHLPSADALSAASFNHQTAIADLLWLDAILYAAQQRERRQPRTALTDYIDTIIELDPHLEPIYYWHYSLRYEIAANPDDEDLQAANRILRTGLDYFPGHWTLARALALNYRGHGFPRTPEERIQDLENAVQYAELAASIDDAPPEMTGFAINLRHRLEEQRKLVAEGAGATHDLTLSDYELDFLLNRYFAADSEERRQMLRHQLRRFGAEEELIDRIAQYDTELRRNHLGKHPHLSVDLYLLVDPHLYEW